MKKYLILGLIFGLLFSVGAVLAARPEFQGATVKNPVTGDPKKTITVPPTAIEVAPGLFSLGTAIDNGKVVEGYAFIDYKKGFAKPPSVGAKGTTCYGFLAKGAKWKSTEPYVVAQDVDVEATTRDLETWDSQVLFEIFGDRDITSIVDGADTISPDQKNEIMFGDIQNSGAIAVAIVWGIFSGPPSVRELVEYDVVFDNADYTWGDATSNPLVMDFENIATHEFGHATGMADLYTSQCSEQTMYGYANYGEINKRTLEAGDIKGVQELYK